MVSTSKITETWFEYKFIPKTTIKASYWQFDESWIEFAVTIARSRRFLLIGQADIVLHHLIHLHAQLLVYFLTNYLSVDEESNKETDGHEDQSQKNILPKSGAFINSWNLVLVLDKSNAFLGRVDQRVANHLEDLSSPEKSIEIAIIDGSLRIEVNSYLTSLNSI